MKKRIKKHSHNMDDKGDISLIREERKSEEKPLESRLKPKPVPVPAPEKEVIYEQEKILEAQPATCVKEPVEEVPEAHQVYDQPLTPEQNQPAYQADSLYQLKKQEQMKAVDYELKRLEQELNKDIKKIEASLDKELATLPQASPLENNVSPSEQNEEKNNLNTDNSSTESKEEEVWSNVKYISPQNVQNPPHPSIPPASKKPIPVRYPKGGLKNNKKKYNR